VKAVSSHRRRRVFQTEILNLSTWILRHASRPAGFLTTPPIPLVMAVHSESSTFLFENCKACVCRAPLGLLLQARKFRTIPAIKYRPAVQWIQTRKRLNVARSRQTSISGWDAIQNWDVTVQKYIILTYSSRLIDLVPVPRDCSSFGSSTAGPLQTGLFGGAPLQPCLFGFQARACNTLAFRAVARSATH